MSAYMPLNFVQLSSSSSVRVNSSWAFYAMKMILSPFHCALTEVVQSPVRFKSRKSIKEIPVAHEGLACCLDAILLCTCSI